MSTITDRKTAAAWPLGAFSQALDRFLDSLDSNPDCHTAVIVDRRPWEHEVRIDLWESERRGMCVSVILRSGHLSVCRHVPITETEQ